MFEVDIRKLVPKFILGDANGYAIAKAMEAGLNYMNEVIENSVSMAYDFDNVPEWRLDEIAREYDCPYIFSADIAKKRYWIKNALITSRRLGTPSAIKTSLAPYLGEVVVNELPNHHFEVYGRDYNSANESEIMELIGMTQNVRSTLDGMSNLYSTGNIILNAESTVSRSVLDAFILDVSTLT